MLSLFIFRCCSWSSTKSRVSLLSLDCKSIVKSLTTGSPLRRNVSKMNCLGSVFVTFGLFLSPSFNKIWNLIASSRPWSLNGNCWFNSSIGSEFFLEYSELSELFVDDSKASPRQFAQYEGISYSNPELTSDSTGVSFNSVSNWCCSRYSFCSCSWISFCFCIKAYSRCWMLKRLSCLSNWIASSSQSPLTHDGLLQLIVCMRPIMQKNTKRQFVVRTWQCEPVSFSIVATSRNGFFRRNIMDMWNRTSCVINCNNFLTNLIINWVNYVIIHYLSYLRGWRGAFGSREQVDFMLRVEVTSQKIIGLDSVSGSFLPAKALSLMMN